VSLPLPNLPSRRERRGARALGAVSASVLAFPLVGGSAQAATIPFPKPSTPLPSALDVVIPYEKGTLCLTETQPGVIAFAKLLNATYGTHTYGTLRTCAAEHGEGRALDWMLNAGNADQLALGNALTRWLAAPDSSGRPGAMARRFGINYIIWNRQQWNAWDPGMAWKPYYGSAPHTDHIHFSFTWDGACERTSWWTGKALTSYVMGPLSSAHPCAPSTTATGYPYLVQGASGADVVTLQKVIGAEPDGNFGPLTAAALGTWQSKNGVPVTKAADEATWSTMVARGLVPSRTGSSSSGSSSSGSSGTSSGTSTASPLAKYVSVVLKRGSSGEAVRVLQKAIGGLTVDGSFGPLTEARVKAYQKSKGLAQTGVVDTKVWNALMGKSTSTSSSSGSSSTGSSSTGSSSPAGSVGSTTTSPLAKYVGVTLRLWSRGEAVKAMQKAIGGLAVDGSFGPLTEARVKAYEKSKGLTVNGVVDAKVWNALMGKPAATSTPSTTTSTPPSSSSSSTGASTASTTTEFTALKSTTLKRGSTGTAVKTLQHALGGLAVDGRFGPMTEARVKAFQSSAKLSVTGVADRKTWDALELKVHPLLPYWNVVVKRGSTGTAVKALQRALHITVDGHFGPQTEASVKAAQKAARLAQTGVVATLTWKAIEGR
jgi:peptidoglycan hydrolase-like protein with peptidoglycan-binding domain